MTRVLAFLGAAALVLGAIVARSAIDSDGGDGGPGNSGDDGLTLVCGTDLAFVCNELASTQVDLSVTVQAEADTVDALASGDLVLDDSTAWLAAGPWPEVARAGGTESLGTDGQLVSSEVLARSPAVIVSRQDRADAIDASCGAVTWACIGESAGGPWTDVGGEAAWGRIEVGLPQVSAGSGMVTVNQAVASRVGTTDFAINDVADDPAVTAWFDRLASQSGANTTGATPLGRFLQVPGSLGVVGALESEAIVELSAAAAASTLVVVAPEPVVTADVRLFAQDDDALAAALDAVQDADRMADAFAAGGWRNPETGTVTAQAADADIIASVTTPLPDSDGLAAPGVVSAVDTRWKDAQ